MKHRFKFRLDDKSYCEDDIPLLIDHPKYNEVISSMGKFYKSQSVLEREWRNRELTGTDWMLVSDATYGGESLAGTQKLEDIMGYRVTLREYNLTTDDRPTRPTWFKD